MVCHMSVEALSPAGRVSLLSAKAGKCSCGQESSGSRVQSPTLALKRLSCAVRAFNLQLTTEIRVYS